ncbi:hypothetical protein E2320_023009 [Naja naja]|nr:hypothetical protein E2320_023009 [Naja naja]
MLPVLLCLLVSSAVLLADPVPHASFKLGTGSHLVDLVHLDLSALCLHPLPVACPGLNGGSSWWAKPEMGKVQQETPFWEAKSLSLDGHFGPHVILQVMRPYNFNQEEEKMAQMIKEVFGLQAKDYMILLFICKDYLKSESLENFVTSRDKKLTEYVAECGNRYLFFNNDAKGVEQEAQVAQLMTMIDDLVHTNRCAPCYTEHMMNVNKRHNF